MRPCHFFLRPGGVLGIGHPVVFLFHHCITFCNKCKLCWKWHWRRVRVKWSVILMDFLGLDIFSTLWIKGKVLYRERAQLKVSGWPLVWNELVTKKSPMFLSRLNKISGGCEKIIPVSESFWSNLEILRTIDLTAGLWGWDVWVNGMRSVLFFSAVYSADCCWAQWWPAWTTETG